MKLFTGLPLRITLPAILILFTLLLDVSIWHHRVQEVESTIEYEILDVAFRQLNNSKRTLEHFLRQNDFNAVQKEITALATDRHLQFAFLCDKDLTILSADKIGWIGRAVRDYLEENNLITEYPDLLHAVTEISIGKAHLNHDNLAVEAHTPILPGTESAGIRPSHRGVLYLRYDLADLKATARDEVVADIQQFSLILVFFVSGLLLYLYFVIHKRAQHLIATADSAAAGFEDRRATLTGNDELARIGSALDNLISQRNTAVGDIAERERFMRVLTDNLPILIGYVDASGKYQFVNRQYEKWFCIPREEILQRSVCDVVGSINYAALTPYINQVMAGNTVQYEDQFLLPDGTTLYYSAGYFPHTDENGTVLGYYLMIEDITPRKKGEDELSLLVTAIEQTEESIVVTDHDARILYVNPSFERITGYRTDEVIGKNPRILKSGAHSPAFYQEMWQTLLQKKVWKGLLLNKKKDGSIYEEEGSITPVIDHHGKITNYVCVKHDVTEKKTIEQRLQQAQKMEAIGTLAGGIAHDFNNILAVIIGYTEMLAEDLAANPAGSAGLQQILEAATRAKDLVSQILAFSRQSEQELKPVSPHIIIKETIKLLRASIPSTIEMRSDIENCGMILADATQIHQIIMNLCTNAYHAMAATGGVLTVKLKIRIFSKAETASRMLDIAQDSYVHLSIADTGQGIDKLTIGKIFDPYFTTKEQGKGTGLGLAVVHGIVQSYGGIVDVSSELGKGTTFDVYLPRIEVDTDSPLAHMVPVKELPGGKEHILIVDDEESIVKIEIKMLESLGYKTTGFSSSVEALRAIRERGCIPDLVITDMTMPKMTGEEFARNCLAIYPGLPIILCTGFSELIDEEKAKALGIREFVLKPIIKKRLAEVVRKALDG